MIGSMELIEFDISKMDLVEGESILAETPDIYVIFHKLHQMLQLEITVQENQVDVCFKPKAALLLQLD